MSDETRAARREIAREYEGNPEGYMEAIRIYDSIQMLKSEEYLNWCKNLKFQAERKAQQPQAFQPPATEDATSADKQDSEPETVIPDNKRLFDLFRAGGKLTKVTMPDGTVIYP